jgi:hypothetical protein
METLTLHEKTMQLINNVHSLLQRHNEDTVKNALIVFCKFTSDEADSAIKLTKDFKGMSSPKVSSYKHEDIF